MQHSACKRETKTTGHDIYTHSQTHTHLNSVSDVEFILKKENKQ